MDFYSACLKFWEEFGDHKLMVLSTASGKAVSSRMMSVIAFDRSFYFQTDIMSRKYAQLKENDHAALCADNIQIEGICREAGHPSENPSFCALYEKCFPGSFQRYTNLQNERLFRMEPIFIERWVYIDGEPFTEKIDLSDHEYFLKKYDVA